MFSCKTQLLEQKRTYVSEENAANATLKDTSNATFYFIRHAEAKTNEKNPHLSGDGLKRTHLWARFFENKKVDTVFTTNLNRTLTTAETIAKKKKVPIAFYDPFQLDYDGFVEKYKNKSLIIVGHSNTTPNFVNKIAATHEYSQMVDKNYSDVYTVVILNGKVISHHVARLEDEIQKMEDAKLSPKELKKVLKERKKAAKAKEKADR